MIHPIPNITLGITTGGTSTATGTAQSGPQTLFFYAAASLNSFASGNPNVLANTTTLGASTPMINGGIGSGALTLYGGTTNIRLDVGTNDGTRQRFWVGNNAAGNSLIVNGSSTLTIDRNTGSYSAKHLAFSDMTIGSSVFSVTSGNYVLEINGATKLVGTPTVSVTNSFLLNGAVSDGGSRQAIIKTGGGDLWVNNTTSTFGGLLQGALGTNGIGIVVNGGLLRFGDVNSEGGTAMNMATILRNSTIRVNPTGNIRIGGAANAITFANGQIEQLSSGSQLSLFRILTVAGTTPTNLQNWLTSNSNGVISLDVTYPTNLNLSAIGNGAFFLGATAGVSYSGTTLGVGAGNLYRIGGGGTANALTMDAASTTTGVLTGTAGVLYGSQAGNGNGVVLLADVNNYSGNTVVSRSTSLLFNIAATGATTHPLGNAGQVDVFGTIEARTNGSFRNSGLTANQNVVVLHPGSVLFLNNNVTTANYDRWDNSTAVNLNGAQLQINSLNNSAVATNLEDVGAITYGRGAIISIANQGTGAVGLRTPSFTRTNGGTIQILTGDADNGTTVGLGRGAIGTANVDNLFAGTGVGAATNVTPSGVVNGMLPAYIINGTDSRFVTYGANGFVNAAFTNTINGGDLNTPPAITAASIVDVTAAALTLVQDVSLYALRINQSINSGVGQYNTITFSNGTTDADRGGLIITNPTDNTSVTIATDLKFGTNGDKEGVVFINAVGTNRTATMSGDIYAGSMTKFGTGTLVIAKDQTANARGTGGGFTGNWSVNQGNLQLNTFGASGTGVITLNPSSPNTAAGTTLFLRANPGSSLNGLYTMSKVVVVDNAIIDVNSNSLNDSTVSIGDLEVQSTDTTGLSPARARIIVANQRAILGVKTLSLTGTGASIIDVNASALNNQITSGVTTGVAVDGLSGTRDLIKWGNGALYVRGNNTGFTGNVIVEQGSFAMANATALSAAGNVTVRRYGVFEILAAGVTKLPFYEAGSIERWGVEGARSGGSLATPISLGAATLQVAADQFTTNAVVSLNGGSIEGFLRTDDVLSGNNGVVYRTLGSGVSIVLTGNSFVGQDPLFGGPNGLNNGRSSDIQVSGGSADVNNASNQTETARGVILEIKGNITESGGSFGLSKQSGDTVILSGANTYTGVTNIAGGTLVAGASGGISPNSVVRMYGSSVLDISGNDVSTRGLVSATVGGDFVSSAGFITNSATTTNTITSNTTAANASFGGVIQNNLGVTKSGAFAQTLTGANTYSGATTVTAGTLTVDGSIAGSSVTVQASGRLNGGNVTATTLVSTPGAVATSITVQSGGFFSAGSNTAVGTNNNGVGQLNVTGTTNNVTWVSGSTMNFDFLSTTGTAGTQWDYLLIDGNLKFDTSGNFGVNVDAWLPNNTGYGQNSFASNGTYQWKWVTAGGIVDSANNPIADSTYLSMFGVTGGGVFAGSVANYAPSAGSNFWISKQGGSLFMNYGVRAVPEPGSLTLVGLAGLGLAGYRRLRKKPARLDQIENVADKD